MRVPTRWMCAANPCTMRLEAYEIMAAANEALRTILPIAGWSEGQVADVVFTGGADPVLPTPFRIGAAGAATLAATGLAATELWQTRTGRRQRVTVDRQATAALRSSQYIQLAGAGVSSARNVIMGFYPGDPVARQSGDCRKQRRSKRCPCFSFDPSNSLVVRLRPNY
jgi:hypothetical protein